MKTNKDRSWLIAIVIGIIAFYIIVGPLALIPTNIGWLGSRFDPTQHYLGWAFYREAPWSFPIGLNPGFGIDISSSIIYSDSIPLLAFLLKPFSNFLPETFQYLGAWLLLCFILQSLFGWLLTGLFTQDKVIRLLSAAIFSFAPVLIWRIDQHVALVSHFLILASLYLCFDKQKNHRTYWWLLLIICSALIQFYICAIVLALWISNLFERRYTYQSASSYSILKDFLFIALCLLITLWVSGFFVINSKYSVTNHYGLLRLNLLSLFDAGGWSYILKDIKDTPIVYDNYKVILGSYYESYAYLGLGGILLLTVSVSAAITKRISIRNFFQLHPFLFIALALLTIFAISNNIGIGPLNYSVPIPNWLNKIASIFRASGRFFWPTYYLILLGCIYIASKFLSQKWAITLLSCTLFLQVVDTYPGWGPLRKAYLVKPSPVNPYLENFLQSPFWNGAGKKYQSLEVVPLNPDLQWQDNWLLFASYANVHHMSTNAVFLSRTDYEKLNAANEKYNAAINSGLYNSSTLYIIDDSKVLSAVKNLNGRLDLFAKIDGFNVIAPNWQACLTCLKIPQNAIYTRSDLTPKINEEINFLNAPFNTPIYFISGWTQVKMERWSVWDKSELLLLTPLTHSKKLILIADALVSTSHPKQEIEIFLNNNHVQNIVLSKSANNHIQVPLDDAANAAGIIKITFKFKNHISPKSLGISDEARALAISIKSGSFK